MKVPTTATCGRDPPDRQLQSNTPRAAAWHLCESLKWGDVYLLLPKPGSTPGCSLAPSEMLLVSVQRAVPPPHFAKGASWEHNSKGRMTGEEETDLYCLTLCFLAQQCWGPLPAGRCSLSLLLVVPSVWQQRSGLRTIATGLGAS